jgi:predicted permease
MEAAEAEVLATSARLAREFPATNSTAALRMLPLRDDLLGEVRTPLLVLLGAVGLVLLVACANVANLLLARAATREGELAVRAALGAGRERLLRQMLTESAVLALLGGAMGLLLAMWGMQALVAARPEGIPGLEGVGLDGRMLAFTAGVTLVTGLLFGAFPAWQTTRGDLAGSLREGGRGALGARRARRTRGALVVGEMALAVMLLVGAGLLIRSFLALTAVDPGFRAERTLTFELVLPAARYEEEERVRAFYAALEERLRALPGVSAVGAASELPLTGYGALLSFEIQGREVPTSADGINDLALKVVSPGYFRALGIPVRRGRPLSDDDRAGSPPVLLLNEAAARRYLAGTDPLTQRIRVASGDTVFRAVAGVVGDVRQESLGGTIRPEAYVAHAQLPVNGMAFAVRVAGDPLGLVRAVRREVHALDPALPVEGFRTVDEVVAASVAQPRFYTVLLAIFAAVALALAAIGIFGVVSYGVAQRTREIGVRMALGADPRRVRASVVGGALALAAAGMALGLAGALAGTRLLGSLLFGVGAADPLTYAAVGAILLATAALAGYLPARRATRVDPVSALRGP